MAKLFATEICNEVVEDSLRIHGGYGYSKEYEIERLYRDAPLLLIGEGTSEIQKLIIARGLLARNPAVTRGVRRPRDPLRPLPGGLPGGRRLPATGRARRSPRPTTTCSA